MITIAPPEQQVGAICRLHLSLLCFKIVLLPSDESSSFDIITNRFFRTERFI